MPVETVTSSRKELLEVSLGPHHPSTHGVFRMDVQLEGETIVDLIPYFGYLHRNHEKIGESLPYEGIMPYTDRLDYLCPMTNNWGYALAVERMAGIEVPPRAEYLRVILAELTRLANHLALVGFLANDLGALGTPLLYALNQREKILDLFESISGARMMVNFFRFGGLREDADASWLGSCQSFLPSFEKFLKEFETLLCKNEILMHRTQGVGVLSAEDAINFGVTGPMLRASGVNLDIRKAEPYGVYTDLEFRIPLGTRGDCYDRLMVRFLEMHESVRIIRQAIKKLPAGPVMGKAPKAVKPPAGDIYSRIESPKGELGFYLVSDGSNTPHRYRIRPPSLINLTPLKKMCIGAKLADVIVIFGSIDIVLGEVDR